MNALNNAVNEILLSSHSFPPPFSTVASRLQYMNIIKKEGEEERNNNNKNNKEINSNSTNAANDMNH